jgi:hypothetical protein
MLFRYCIRSTFHDVPIFAARRALSENLAACIINDGFGAFNFYMGRGLWHGANTMRLHEGVQYKQAAFDARLQVSWP